ncbi:MAG: hypothetical protein RMI91_02490 [Gemmatales bacterium]|nr:hypothetical protein [Gemmatales bacterium]MDW7993495.1 hypothetical protein [Gemmatales bacterium]
MNDTMVACEAAEYRDVAAELARLRAWEEDLQRREEMLARRERELTEREEPRQGTTRPGLEELAHLEQRIRNARRRLLNLSEEYERLRAKLELARKESETGANSNTPHVALPVTNAEAPPSSAGPADAEQCSARAKSDASMLPLWFRLHPEPVETLAQITEALLDRVGELQELAKKLAELRSQWWKAWQSAEHGLSEHAQRLSQWQDELAHRQEQIERGEAELKARQQALRCQELRLEASQARCEARHRALLQAFTQLKARWRSAARALRQRELRLQCLFDEWRTRTRQELERWQDLHQQAAHWVIRSTQLAEQLQQQLGPIESARYQLWQKQQALEMAVQLWITQTSDTPAAEALLRQCEARLAKRLEDWQQRLEARERQLAQRWQEFQKLVTQVMHLQQQLESARRHWCERHLAEQWQDYCQWASRLRDQVLHENIQHDYLTLREQNASLLGDIERLAACFLNELPSPNLLAQAA